MSNRILFPVVAALALAPVGARAQASQEQESQEQASQEVDTTALQGQVDALAEQVAEMKTDVSGLKKLKFSGYIQARWAWREAAVYNSTPAGAPALTNFTIRRARFKVVYDADWSQYTLQIDATPRGVLLKEAYATLKLPKGLAIDAGLQLMPFGYEVLVRSSSDLDLLERSLTTSFYLAGEYDLGIALKGDYGPFNFKVGAFNGNGIGAWSFASGFSGLDNDQLKDFIGRIGFDYGMITGGVSGWYGKLIDYGSATDEKHDRYRVGADLQVYLDLLPIGGTALKGEFIWGRTGSVAAATLDQTGHGWYALATQNIGKYQQLAARWEEFTPNNTASTEGPANTTVKTERQLQVALHSFVGQAFKLSVAWYHPMNGARGEAAPDDPEADQWIAQAQVKF